MAVADNVVYERHLGNLSPRIGIGVVTVPISGAATVAIFLFELTGASVI